jgi:oligopeptide/dipeptide ABC transporter ATP-binding protein
MLEVRDLVVEIPTAHGLLRAVDGASFSLEEGGTLGLVGESGCGKTMTLRAIVGLLPRRARIASGSVRYHGQELTAMPRSRLRELRGTDVAMIFQEPMTALNPVTRVGDQIAEGPLVRLGYGRRRARARALELMRLVGIAAPERRARAYPHELSGGMRQRVMIAIALACEPKMILCDEPTTALDVTIQDQIIKLLLSLQASAGLAIVFVTHDLAVIAQTCRSVAVMYAGQVVETGAVDTVFRQPHHPYTLSLLRSVPHFDAPQALASIPGTPPNLLSPPPGCRFHVRCPFAGPECTDGAFPLRPLAGGGESACIHHELAAESARRQPVLAGA